jgi:ketosteroid isomerase-like protein
MSQENVEIVRRFVETEFKRHGYVPLEYIDAGGDFVVFVFRLEEMKPPYSFRHGSVFRVREGKVVEWTPYPSKKEARKAAGLSEQDAHGDS